MLVCICTIRSAWFGVIYDIKQIWKARLPQNTQYLTRSYSHFLLHLTECPAILISVHAFFRTSVPKTETRASAKVKAPPRCLSGLLAQLSALEKPQKLDGLPKMALPT
jgi:hypothetical protein